MPLSSFFRKVGTSASDNLVGVASGATPVRGLDSPRFYRSIVALGLIALGVSGWLVYRSIISATALPKIAVNTSVNTNSTALAALESLKNKDTDGDTISDYDELYSTHSSPYLKDSDGDGTPDGTELQKGTDPNCPVGKVCEGFRLLNSVVDANGQLTSEFIRRALASAGVPQTTLDQTDDASLLRIYQQVVKSETPTNTNGSTTTNSTTANSNTVTGAVTNTAGPTALEEIQNLSPDEIRQLMIESGMDKATLDTIDDATLQQIFQQSIQANSTNSTNSNTNQ